MREARYPEGVTGGFVGSFQIDLVYERALGGAVELGGTEAFCRTCARRSGYRRWDLLGLWVAEHSRVHWPQEPAGLVDGASEQLRG